MRSIVYLNICLLGTVLIFTTVQGSTLSEYAAIQPEARALRAVAHSNPEKPGDGLNIEKSSRFLTHLLGLHRYHVPRHSVTPQDTSEVIIEKIPNCAPCRDSTRCESGYCYFGKCVQNGVHKPHSVRRCFDFVDVKDVEDGEECSKCSSNVDCDTGLCKYGRCVYGGTLLHLSVLSCFNDSYVASC